MSETPAGWYPDPSGDASKIRYWDGAQWTDQYQDNPNVVAAPEQTYAVAEQQPYQQQGQPAYQQPAEQQPYQQQGYQQPAYQQPAYQVQQPPVKDNAGLAIASLVLGIIGIPASCFALLGYILGGLSLTFGIMSRKSSKKGIATAGIILGGITLACAVLSSIIGVLYSMS